MWSITLGIAGMVGFFGLFWLFDRAIKHAQGQDRSYGGQCDMHAGWPGDGHC
jgi:hypothetical protein